MQIPKDISDRLHAVLERYSGALRGGLGRALVERTFPPHPMFRGKEAPPLEPEDELRGVRVIYTYGDFVPLICGLSHAGAWKCGARPLLDVNGDLFAGLDDDVFEGITEVQWELVERWIRDAWLAVRAVAPDLRGFVSEHDGGWVTDLDTGETFARIRDVGFDYL